MKVACANIIEKDGSVLLVKETKNYVKDKYSIPAGKLEEEEDIFTCAVREAKEETGLTVELEGIVGIYQLIKSSVGSDVTVFVFKSKIVKGDIVTSKEHPEVRYFEWKEIEKMKDALRSRYIFQSLEDNRSGKLFPLSLVRAF